VPHAPKGMGTGRAQCPSQNFSIVRTGAHIRVFYDILNDYKTPITTATKLKT